MAGVCSKSCQEDTAMPIYALDDHQPDLPEAGQYWVAPDAHVMGLVRLAPLVGIWFGAVLRGA